MHAPAKGIPVEPLLIDAESRRLRRGSETAQPVLIGLDQEIHVEGRPDSSPDPDRHRAENEMRSPEALKKVDDAEEGPREFFRAGVRHAHSRARAGDGPSPHVRGETRRGSCPTRLPSEKAGSSPRPSGG